MFEAFGPSYFEYMARVLFHGVTSSLAKIMGAYVIKITQNQMIKKRFVLVLENLGQGIKSIDEPHIVRYDLKGSESNRFIEGLNPSVNLDSNFLMNMNGRPIIIDR